MEEFKKIDALAREELIAQIKWNDAGLIPAVAQDVAGGDVLMLAWVDREALDKSFETGFAHYHSRSRGRLWKKGETSGHVQKIRDIRLDCDGDTLLFHVEQTGAACHTGRWNCFFREAEGQGGDAVGAPAGPAVLDALFEVIEARKASTGEKSYTKSLFEKGLPKILEKITEESGELVEAAEIKGDTEVVKEFSDVLFHALVLLAHKDIDIAEVYAELGRRFGTSGHTEKASRKK